ncbi:DTW domain containing protein [Nitzschia inconspicua]|uniref:tRNA-uridine aminocarboxypropyltransferase n=1 Tax=Nitzschia inconspicua TaxID=303405 RepID=A0A9K3PYC0_9STRA|nr:DTW domain containing protein [Nitzschia inconspicua]
MKGLPEHDYQIKQDYFDQHPAEKLVVVLWPSNEGKISSVSPTISLQELRSELSSSSGQSRKVVIMAVDGTWRNARRMVGRLPSHIPRLDLPPQIVSECMKHYQDKPSKSGSLLAPLRSQGPSQRKQGESLVCTAEAVVMVLLELGMNSKDGEAILDLARTKVDLVRRYRGHESRAESR